MSVFNDELLFVHIPKTGGTSVREWLWQHLPGVRGQKPETMPGGADTAGMPIGHVPLRDIEHFTGRSPSSFRRIIAILRDPYAQQLSQWRFWRERYAIGQRHPHDLTAAAHPTMDSWLGDPNCDFHLWYNLRIAPENHRAIEGKIVEDYAGFAGYYKYWITVDGRIPDNVRVIRLEDIDHAWPATVESFVADPTIPLRKSNQGPSTPYPVRAYYTKESARMVQLKFRWAFSEHYNP